MTGETKLRNRFPPADTFHRPRTRPAIPPAVLRILDHRLTRLALAATILVILGGIAASRVLYRTSIEAVLNAPRVTLVAPVDGIVDSLMVAAGTPVAAGGDMLRLRRTRWSSGIADERDSRAWVLAQRADALTAEVSTLEALRDSLRSRLVAFQHATLLRLAADTLAAAARLDERQRQLARLESLRDANGATEADIDRLRAEVASAQGDYSRAVAAAIAARDGVVLDAGGQDAPYSRQRLDELQLRLADLTEQRATIAAELATLGVSADRAAEHDRGAAHADTFSVSAPTHGVVWSVSASTGESILRGAPLVTLIDCSRLFFEATIGPREQDRIVPGMAVQVRFAGTSALIPARVAFLRGGGVRETDDAAAQLQFDRRRTDARVVIDVDPDAVGAAPGNFCQVGRSAKVIFDGPELPWRVTEHAPPR